MRFGVRPAVLTLIGCALLLPTPALAWHQAGHMAVTRVAWKQLNDKQRVQYSRILESHPHYKIYLSAECPKDLPEIEWAFLRASTWSDWVRDPFAPGMAAEEKARIRRTYNKPEWHYINLPYVHPADVDRYDAAEIRKTILEPYLDNGEPRHVVAALQVVAKKLQATDASAEEKAIALCWLLHLAGDLHQPLHGTSLIASKETLPPGLFPPHGDLGGNRFLIKFKDADKTSMNLHYYWDAILFRNEPPFADVDRTVADLMNDLTRDKFPELQATDLLTWAEESRQLAEKVAYKHEGELLKAVVSPGRKSSKLAITDAPLLPLTYHQIADDVARRRMVLAGYRIADQLQQVPPSNP